MIHRSVGTIVSSTSQKWTQQPQLPVPLPEYESFEKDRAISAAHGNGFKIEGTVESVRPHTVEVTDGDGKAQFHRFVALRINVTQAQLRVYDDKTGEELETTPFGAKEIVRKGYLTNEKRERKDANIIRLEELTHRIYRNGLISDPPADATGTVELWGLQSKFKAADYKGGVKVRVKTFGDTHILETCGVEEQRGSKYAGEDVRDSWTNKIAVGGEKSDKPLPGDDLEGVDEDEWD